MFPFNTPRFVSAVLQKALYWNNALLSFYAEWDNVWKSRDCIVVNSVPGEVPRPKAEGSEVPRIFGRGSSRGTPLTMIHPYPPLGFLAKGTYKNVDLYRQLGELLGQNRTKIESK